MSDKNLHYVDSLSIFIPIAIWLMLFLPMLFSVKTAIGPVLTYGGNLCNTSGEIVAVCGVPPFGVSVALLVSMAGAFKINQNLMQYLAKNADEHAAAKK